MGRGPKSDVGLTKMCIWIDNNFYADNRDDEKMYTYMYNIALILTRRAGYFDHEVDRDSFANYLANDVYMRMSQVKIKSVLNYMNAIKAFRRLDYCKHFYSEVIKPDFDDGWNGDKYSESCIASLESKNKEILMNNMLESFKNFPNIIKDSVPLIYKADKLLFNNIYRSALLSFISRLTLPEDKKPKLKDNRFNPAFDVSKYLNKYLKEDVILWHLDQSLADVVIITLNKAYQAMCEDIRDSIAMSKVSQDDFANLSRAELRVKYDGVEDEEEQVV